MRTWLTVLLLATVACNQRPPAADVITVAVLSSPNNLDPRIGSDETSQRVHQLVFDYLLALDDKLRPTGGLSHKEIVEIISRRREEETAASGEVVFRGDGGLTRVPTRELPPLKPKG